MSDSFCKQCRGTKRVRSVACDHEGCFGDCGHTIECSACKPPAVPEMPEVCVRLEPLVYVPLKRLRALLAPQGLRIVGEAEAKVLEAIDAIPEQELRSSGNRYGWAKPIGEAVRAQRARRAQQKEKP